MEDGLEGRVDLKVKDYYVNFYSDEKGIKEIKWIWERLEDELTGYLFENILKINF